MSRLTAKEAASMAKAKDPSFAVDAILKGILKAASDGKYSYTTREYGFGSGECYGNEDAWPALNRAIVKELRGLGYSCDLRVYEGQFVDLWLEVKWGEV